MDRISVMGAADWDEVPFFGDQLGDCLLVGGFVVADDIRRRTDDWVFSYVLYQRYRLHR